jgi:hypothetical protein
VLALKPQTATQEMRVKAVRIIFFLLIVFLAIPEFMLGVPSLVNGIRAHGDVWSVRHDYFTDAAITLIGGLLAVGFAAWGAFWPGKTNWLRFVVATGIVLLMLVSIPSWYYPETQGAASRIKRRMYDAQLAAEQWSQAKGKYPLTAEELKAALGPPMPSSADVSPFHRGSGEQVPFEWGFAANASGPTLRADRPAVINYAVDADGKHFWITATTLAKPVGDEVTMLKEGGSPLVIPGELQPPPTPPAAVTPKKK